MTENKKKAALLAAKSIIANLEKRQIQGYYYDSSTECINHILSILPKNSTISWGGSETLLETGLLDALHSNEFSLLDRKNAKTPDEMKVLYSQIVMSDYFFTSSNAITLEGELINIDGNGNRLACLLQGPSNVIIVIGVNKIVADINAGYQRIKQIAAPANVQRLHKKTPCSIFGTCENCYSSDCICSHTVITRRSSQKNRIQVFIIGEELGY